MKQYLKDLWHEVKYPLMVAVAASICLIVAIQQKWSSVSINIFGSVVVVVACVWGPFCEEKFKRSHSLTKREALVFGFLEFAVYGWQIMLAGIWGYMWCRIPMLVLHSASSMCYHHYPNSKRVFYFWFLMHSMWNTIGTVRPTWVLMISDGKIYPTVFTCALVLLWLISLLCKLKQILMIL